MNKRKIEKKIRNKMDKEWSKLIKERDKGCVICGDTNRLNAHHLIPRQIKEYRYDARNGIALCPRHHKYSYEISAHKNSIAFLMWLSENRKEQYDFIISQIEIYKNGK